jgi:hypothetical protein
MMHKTQGWTGLRNAVIAMGLVAWTATGATAAPISEARLNYTTSGQIDTTTGVSGGTNVISYVPLSQSGQNLVDLSGGTSNVGFGHFTISPLPPGTSTTYNNTPFQISVLPESFNGSTDVANSAPILMTGVLNGTVSGSSVSTVQATFNSLSNSEFSIGDAGSVTLTLPASSIYLSPSTSANGETTAQGLLTFTASDNGGIPPVPEPSSIALFVTTIGGLALRRRVQARRKAKA